MEVFDVFTPGKYPEYTYVERGRGKHEQNLKFQLQDPPTIVSLSGPSKSGKTMLLKNVVDKLNYNLVTVRGTYIDSIESLWGNTLDQLGAPAAKEVTQGTQDETEKEGKAGVNVSVVNANAGGTKRSQKSTQETVRQGRRGLKQIVDLVDLEEFVLFIDDAHYISEECHSRISEGIKDAYERGISICVAFIPHRSDDLTRANPDLSGRIESINLEYWDQNDLEKIGQKGFKNLNRYPSDHLLTNLSKESIGSPHLMQKLCLELCNELDIYEQADDMTPLKVNPDDIKRVLRRTGNSHDYSTAFEIVSGGAAQGGSERNIFSFGRGREGDVYDAILRAIASNPPKLTLDQGEVIQRVEEVCVNDSPRSGNITQAIQRIDKWISNSSDNTHVFEWADDRRSLEIPDPYLIFYLRWSDKLDFEPKLH